MKLFKREKYLKKIRGFYDSDDLIKVITGIRRSGKSSLMQTIADELVDNGVPKENIYFFNLDKRGFKSIRNSDQLDDLIVNTCTAKGMKYLFIDEIQNVDEFELTINAFREEGNYSIFITGSNSYLLSGELTTKLTGRYLEFEIFTLTFDEYIGMKKFYKKEIDPNMNNELNNFILEGGFPRAIRFDNMQDKRNYVKNVLDEIFTKDIKRRVKIRNVEAFEKTKTFIINNFGSSFSIKNLHEALLKDGLKISRQTLSNYIDALVSAKILYECPRFDMKSKRSLSSNKKYYITDTSMYYAYNTDNRINYGPTLENLVYFYSKSFDYQISVGRIGKFECDFILRGFNFNYVYIQVAFTILNSLKTEDREYRPLEKISDNYPKYVMTCDTFIQKRNGIIHVNIPEFMSDGNTFE